LFTDELQVRWKSLIIPHLFFKFCQAFPNAARKVLRRRTEKLLPSSIPHDPNFQPKYGPWEQRLCVCPDGDFFEALRDKNCDVVTSKIKNITATSIEIESGQTLDADIIITATGLKIQLVGGATVSVDGVAVDFSKKFVWKGVMLQDIPNACLVIGYTNASWTLGADTTAQLVCRLLKHMEKNNQSSAVPRLPQGTCMKAMPIMNLSSTYVEKAKDRLPLAGDVAPWNSRDNYLTDYWVSQYGNLTSNLEFREISKKLN
jgi:cation diffusion facilitator CzcD-associated flavoprotein CzcO